MLNLLRRRRDLSEPASKLYSAIVAQSRNPVFFRDLGVPDTVLGRFEMIALHAYLVFRRLREAGTRGRELSQSTHDLMFADMDLSLRELGIGDMGIGKRVKSLARNLYGRIEAFEEGLEQGDDVLVGALQRNVYATAEASPRADQVAALAGYMKNEAAYLRGQPDEALLAGEILFGAVPVPVPGEE